MQTYIDEFAKRCENERKKAVEQCAQLTEAIKAHKETASAVIASILGVPADEISRDRSYPYDTRVKRWPGVEVDVSLHKSWRAYKAKLDELLKRKSECCDREKAAKEAISEKSLFALRRFIRARFGASTKAKPSVVIDAFLAAVEPFTCKAG